VKHLGETRPFRGPDGRVVRGSIAEVNYLFLGGVDQWVLIRGESLTNPPLILLHGGPGFSETHFFRRFNAPPEKIFTIVYLDQRGSGKSFDRKINRSGDHRNRPHDDVFGDPGIPHGGHQMAGDGSQVIMANSEAGVGLVKRASVVVCRAAEHLRYQEHLVALEAGKVDLFEVRTSCGSPRIRS
jgi:hypothetical protein